MDAAVHAGELAELTEQLDTERMMYWVWGSAGAAISAVVVGLLVGLAR